MKADFQFVDVDVRATCECGEFSATGDAPVDAFSAWWKHKATAHPDAD
jgi:hypothetical protein